MLWETPRQAAARQYSEAQYAERERQQLLQQLASLGLNFAGDDFNNQFRLANLEGDVLQQQLQNQRTVQNAQLNVAQMAQRQAERSNREVDNPYQRTRRVF